MSIFHFIREFPFRGVLDGGKFPLDDLIIIITINYYAMCSAHTSSRLPTIKGVVRSQSNFFENNFFQKDRFDL